jgi:hypothetical protein
MTDEDRIVREFAEAFGRDYDTAKQRALEREQEEEQTLP